MNSGKFITLEGPDGSGKSTIAHYIVDYLTSHGIQTLYTREPGGTDLAEAVRSILLSPDFKIDDTTELMLFMAARSHHLKFKVKPALEKGTWVVCDRFTDSTLAYQSDTLEKMWELHEWLKSCKWLITPDMTLYLKITWETALRRMKLRNEADNRIESSLHERIDNMLQCYDDLARHEKHYRVVDANAELSSVKAQVESHLQKLLDNENKVL